MWLGRHVEVAGDREESFEHAPNADVLDRQAADRLAHCSERGGELLGIMVGWDILRFEMDVGDAAVIAGDQAVEDLGKPAPGAAVDPFVLPASLVPPLAASWARWSGPSPVRMPLRQMA